MIPVTRIEKYLAAIEQNTSGGGGGGGASTPTATLTIKNATGESLTIDGIVKKSNGTIAFKEKTVADEGEITFDAIESATSGYYQTAMFFDVSALADFSPSEVTPGVVYNFGFSGDLVLFFAEFADGLSDPSATFTSESPK